ncbi:hypothetical protein [Streptomyces exfoliatus]|uniref:hypothetical protein n=1 Tax=Streptomyces exfoliatus TaxID=1905 RepID=UPI0004C994A4|nr:hypothetical protein [Streptomyces exfoliatus]
MQYEAHQRARAEPLHTALAKAVQERAEAWDDLNALADDDADASVDHPVNVRVVAACRNLAAIYRDLALAEPAFSHDYEAEAGTFTRAADRFAEHGRSATRQSRTANDRPLAWTVRRVKAARNSTRPGHPGDVPDSTTFEGRSGGHGTH